MHMIRMLKICYSSNWYSVDKDKIDLILLFASTIDKKMEKLWDLLIFIKLY